MRAVARHLTHAAAVLTRGALLASVVLATAACSRGPGRAGPLPATPGTSHAVDPLSKAIETYQRTGNAGDLQAYIDVHPGDDRAVVWREMLALDAYERAWTLGDLEAVDDDDVAAFDPAPMVNTRTLKTIVDDYPDTFAAQMAGAGLDTEHHVLEAAALRFLGAPTLNTHVVAFLSGDDTWARGVDTGEDEGVQIDLRRFRRRHEARLKDAVRRTLLDDKCGESMGYCRWYVAQFPADDTTEAIQVAIRKEWWRRGHPPWQGKAHLQCAYDCARTCRDQPVTLDDTCFDTCFERC